MWTAEHEAEAAWQLVVAAAERLVDARAADHLEARASILFRKQVGAMVSCCLYTKMMFEKNSKCRRGKAEFYSTFLRQFLPTNPFLALLTQHDSLP